MTSKRVRRESAGQMQEDKELVQTRTGKAPLAGEAINKDGLCIPGEKLGSAGPCEVPLHYVKMAQIFLIFNPWLPYLAQL